MDVRDKILLFLKAHGPSLPTKVKNEIETDSMLASAYLSELKGLGKVAISHLKIGGGSPLYYVPEHSERLQDFAKNLGEKEYKVFELLKEKKVLRDTQLVPVFRSAIRTIKDFSRSLTVNFQGKQETFWHYYLTPREEAEVLIRKMLGMDKVQKNEKPKVEPKKAIPAAKTQSEIRVEQKESQQSLSKQSDAQSEFHQELLDHFNKNKITIIEEDIIRKKTEIDFIVELPSPLGNLRYYVKAKAKKKVNDGDLSTAFIKGQSKRLPVLFISKGDLTKKAQELLDSEFKGMKVSKIGS